MLGIIWWANFSDGMTLALTGLMLALGAASAVIWFLVRRDDARSGSKDRTDA